jgi:hypothetical protein
LNFLEKEKIKRRKGQGLPNIEFWAGWATSFRIFYLFIFIFNKNKNINKQLKYKILTCIYIPLSFLCHARNNQKLKDNF